MVCEQRLVLLVRTHGAQRIVQFERVARTLSKTIFPGSGVNVADIAYALLLPDRYSPFLARAYYRRLDRAEWMTAVPNQEAPA